MGSSLSLRVLTPSCSPAPYAGLIAVALQRLRASLIGDGASGYPERPIPQGSGLEKCIAAIVFIPSGDPSPPCRPLVSRLSARTCSLQRTRAGRKLLRRVATARARRASLQGRR